MRKRSTAPRLQHTIGVCDEYIAVYDVNGMHLGYGLLQALMEKFHRIYGKYPEYQLPTPRLPTSTTICTVKNTEWENT